jgi:hypothetical protein
MKIVKHPHHDLLAEAKREREVAESPEGQARVTALMDAARAYWDFLDRNHVIYEDDTSVEYAGRLDGSAADVPVYPRVKATALVVTVTLCGTIDVTLKDGALDRVYGNGQNPDPDDRGPADIPHEPRKDELI